MPTAILDNLSLIDTVGRFILATTFMVLLLALCANVVLRGRYASIERDLGESPGPGTPAFSHRVLDRIVRSALDAARRAPEVNTQAIVEEGFATELRMLLLGERFIKAATGLVIILGLLGTFYGLTLSVGRLVHLVSTDAGAAVDVSQAVTSGLTHALAGMTVAFSNSLVGITSAVVLTVAGIFSNVTDRRTSLMVRIETYVDRLVSDRASPRGAEPLGTTIAGFSDTIGRLDASVTRFESALTALATRTGNLREFNVQIVATKPRDER